MSGELIFLFKNRTTDGNGTAMPLPFPTNRAKIKAYGTWDGASVKLQCLASDGSTWIDVSEPKDDGSLSVITFTANSEREITDVLTNESYRAVMSNDGAGTTVTIEAQGF